MSRPAKTIPSSALKRNPDYAGPHTPMFVPNRSTLQRNPEYGGPHTPMFVPVYAPVFPSKNIGPKYRTPNHREFMLAAAADCSGGAQDKERFLKSFLESVGPDAYEYDRITADDACAALMADSVGREALSRHGPTLLQRRSDATDEISEFVALPDTYAQRWETQRCEQMTPLGVQCKNRAFNTPDKESGPSWCSTHIRANVEQAVDECIRAQESRSTGGTPRMIADWCVGISMSEGLLNAFRSHDKQFTPIRYNKNQRGALDPDTVVLQCTVWKSDDLPSDTNGDTTGISHRVLLHVNVASQAFGMAVRAWLATHARNGGAALGLSHIYYNERDYPDNTKAHMFSVLASGGTNSVFNRGASILTALIKNFSRRLCVVADEQPQSPTWWTAKTPKQLFNSMSSWPNVYLVKLLLYSTRDQTLKLHMHHVNQWLIERCDRTESYRRSDYLGNPVMQFIDSWDINPTFIMYPTNHAEPTWIYGRTLITVLETMENEH